MTQPDSVQGKPLVSVIMPAYNARPYIGQAIRSVLEQDYPHIELIIVDDGSRDGTPEEVAGFGDKVRFFQRANGGPAAARNFGIAQSQGEIISFLDADDLWLPGKLTAQLAYLQAYPDVGVVFGKFLRWEAKPDGSFDPPPVPQGDQAGQAIVSEHSGWIYPELLFDNIVHIITVAMRRSVIEAVGVFDEQWRTGEDYDFWLRVSRHTKADKLDRTLSYYRIHPQSTTAIPRPVNNEYAVLLKTIAQHGTKGPDGNQASPDKLKERMFGLCFNHGYFHYWRGDPGVAAKAFADAIRHGGLRPRSCIYWCLAQIKQRFGLPSR